MKSYSQIDQDIFVLETLKEKRNGVFVDIGCSEPTYISNTYALEKDYGWSGIAIDITNQCDYRNEELSWEVLRPNSTHIIQDALTINYEELFKQYNLPEFIDYLTLDLEPPKNTFECLKLIPFDKYKFRCITFETDFHRNDDGSSPETGTGIARRDQSREFLRERNYTMVKQALTQDDYYIHNDLLE